MEENSNVFLGLGSNKGDKLAHLAEAVARMNNDEMTHVEAVSSVYETEPFGVKEQDNFLNAVIKITTRRNLKELFRWVKVIEKEIGRTESIKWGPREIDIDILFFDDQIISDDELTVPHPGIMERDFVFVPLLEIAPEFVHPESEMTLRDIDNSEMEKLILKMYPVDLLNYNGENVG